MYYVRKFVTWRYCDAWMGFIWCIANAIPLPKSVNWNRAMTSRCIFTGKVLLTRVASCVMVPSRLAYLCHRGWDWQQSTGRSFDGLRWYRTTRERQEDASWKFPSISGISFGVRTNVLTLKRTHIPKQIVREPSETLDTSTPFRSRKTVLERVQVGTCARNKALWHV